MVPIFYLETVGKHELPPDQNTSRRKNRCWSLRNLLWKRTTANDENSKNLKQSNDRVNERIITGIGMQMTSVFITMPSSNTVITFNKESKNNNVAVKIDNRHETTLAHCWSRVQDELNKSYSKLRQYDGQYLAYSFLDQAVDVIGPIISDIKNVIDVEKQNLHDQHYRNMSRIHLLRDELRNMSRRLKPFTRLLVHVIEDETISHGAYVFHVQGFQSLLFLFLINLFFISLPPGLFIFGTYLITLKITTRYDENCMRFRSLRKA
jgi:hypothetical protein